MQMQTIRRRVHKEEGPMVWCVRDKGCVELPNLWAPCKGIQRGIVDLSSKLRDRFPRP